MSTTIVADNKKTSPIYALRERKKNEVIDLLREDVNRLRSSDLRVRVLLIGSFATGDWDSYSDIDVICVSDKQYCETDFKISRQFPMDVFSLNESEFNQRMNSGEIFKQSVEKGISL